MRIKSHPRSITRSLPLLGLSKYRIQVIPNNGQWDCLLTTNNAYDEFHNNIMQVDSLKYKLDLIKRKHFFLTWIPWDVWICLQSRDSTYPRFRIWDRSWKYSLCYQVLVCLLPPPLTEKYCNLSSLLIHSKVQNHFGKYATQSNDCVIKYCSSLKIMSFFFVKKVSFLNKNAVGRKELNQFSARCRSLDGRGPRDRLWNSDHLRLQWWQVSVFYHSHDHLCS